MKQHTKARILQIGAEIIHRKGFNNTGIQEILNRAEVPKGSFYNYFGSKEDFGLQIIDYFTAQFKAINSNFLEDSSLPAIERIRRILESFKEVFRANDFSCGCPIGNLSQEMGDLSPAFRAKLKEAMDDMVGMYAGLIREAQKSGDISQVVDPEDVAYFIVSSWHGALIRMKIVKGPEPLENHIRFIFGSVLKA